MTFLGRKNTEPTGLLFRFPRAEYNQLTAQRPGWFVQLVIAIGFGAGYIFALNLHIGWEPESMAGYVGFANYLSHLLRAV